MRSLVRDVVGAAQGLGAVLVVPPTELKKCSLSTARGVVNFTGSSRSPWAVCVAAYLDAARVVPRVLASPSTLAGSFTLHFGGGGLCCSFARLGLPRSSPILLPPSLIPLEAFVALGRLAGLRFDYDSAGMKAGTGGAGRASGFQPGECAVAFWD